MGYMKNLAIDQMNEQAKQYSVHIQVANGPDDYDWDEVYTSDKFMDAVHEAISLRDKGHSVKLYDPFMDEVVPIP